METKNLVLREATIFFNERGATGTSLRQLASFLGMSDGNLRYHFKNKEELVLAIFNAMLQDMEGVIKEGNKEAEDVLQEVKKKFAAIFKIMYHYKFLFIESPLLLKKYPDFKQAFLQLFEARKAFFIHFFQEFKQKGLFREDLEESFYERTFEQIFIISDNWIKYHEIETIEGANTIDSRIEHYVNLCLCLLIPALKK